MGTPARSGSPSPPEQEDLNRGILPTEIAPGLARAMSGLFVVAIFLVPVLQVGVELFRGGTVQALTLFRRPPTQENLHAFEKDLEDQSVVRNAVQPLLQQALTRSLGFGNASVVVGREGWLFYRQGVDFLTSPGLLDQVRLRLRAKELLDGGEKNPCPDPRAAILAFHEECRKAGVHLVVVPVPDKAMLQPAELTARLAFSTPCEAPTNADHARLLAELRSAGVDVYDPTPRSLVPGEKPRFLRQDTHWTPEWMETVAEGLAAHLRSRVSPLQTPTHAFAAARRGYAGWATWWTC